MEVPRLGVQLELQVLAYARATATRDPSHICNLHLSSRQCQILNPLSKARDGTCILMDTIPPPKKKVEERGETKITKLITLVS